MKVVDLSVYTMSGSIAAGGFLELLPDIAIIVGMIIAGATFLVSTYYRHKQDKRDIEHKKWVREQHVKK